MIVKSWIYLTFILIIGNLSNGGTEIYQSSEYGNGTKFWKRNIGDRPENRRIVLKRIKQKTVPNI